MSKKSQLLKSIIREEIEKQNKSRKPTLKTEMRLRNIVKKIIEEEMKKSIWEGSMMNELSPELLKRASDKAKEQGRTLQANKFAKAATTQILKKATADNNAKLAPMKPFVGKTVNFYYDFRSSNGTIFQAIEVPHEITEIEVDTNGAMIVSLFGQNSETRKIEGFRNDKFFGFVPDDDNYKLSNIGWQGENFIIRGMDQSSAQLFFKLAKAFKPDTTVTPNTLIDGAPTPIKGKSF